jgi:hypothetical protein
MSNIIQTGAPVITFPVTAAELEERLAPLAACTFATPAAYRDGVKAIAVCRDLRGEIEDKRVELNEAALAHQRAVNAMAKGYVARIEAIEKPLKAAKQAADDAKALARQRAAEAAAEQERIEREAMLAAQEAVRRAEREA